VQVSRPNLLFTFILLASIASSTLNFHPAFALDVFQCPPGVEICNANVTTPLSDGTAAGFVDKGKEVGLATINLLGLLHDLDMMFVQWILATFGITLPPIIITLIGTALVTLTGFLLGKALFDSMKHVAIVMIIFVAIVMAVPYIPK
jgi:hypothetical protein